MKIQQRLILLQFERKPLFVYTTAGLTKVWIHYDIRDSDRRSQQGPRLYIPDVSRSDFCSHGLPQPQGLPPGTAVERCYAKATRLGLETSRWKSPTRKHCPSSSSHVFVRDCKVQKTWTGLLGCTWYL